MPTYAFVLDDFLLALWLQLKKDQSIHSQLFFSTNFNEGLQILKLKVQDRHQIHC